MNEQEIYKEWCSNYEAAFPHRGPISFGQKQMWKHGFNALRVAASPKLPTWLQFKEWYSTGSQPKMAKIYNWFCGNIRV
jgi:hypothetical protein